MDLEIVDDLRRPEYTGENRCEPCTVLNLAIAAVAGAAIARRSRVAGAIAVTVSIALIYLRGYLVPGTPTLTKRYLPPEVLRWFGKEPEPTLATGLGAGDGATPGPSATTDPEPPRERPDEPTPADRADGSPATDRPAAESAASDDLATDSPTDPAVHDLETYFLERGVLEPCDDRDDLCLTDAFEAAWLEAIERVDDEGLDAATTIDAFDFDADPDAFTLEDHDDASVLASDRGPAGRWPSRAALLADVAGSHVLADWTDDWDALDPDARGQVLNGLRMFLETCPGAGGAISMTEETVESCCTSHEVVAVVCDETGDRLFEQRVDPSLVDDSGSD